MSSLKSYLRQTFGKSHKYETQADLKDMTAEQIVNIEPEEVGFYLRDETGGIPLEGVKRNAMNTLLSIKTEDDTLKKAGIKNGRDTSRVRKNGREIAINSFLNRPEVRTKIVQKDMEEVREEVDRKDMTNRLRALKNLPPSEIYTEEESMVKRLNALKAGKRKTVSKRKRKGKTRKGRKASGKTNKRRN
jgi:hypothetical protein